MRHIWNVLFPDDEIMGKNAAMRRILALTPPIPPPREYPVPMATEQVELALRLWERKVGRR